MEEINTNNRPDKSYRAKLTVMMDPSIVNNLKKRAIDVDCSVSDILEDLAKEYLRTS